MKLHLLFAALSCACTFPALAQPAAQGIPDFSGLWAHPNVGIETPVSGPSPVHHKGGAIGSALLVGDDTNPVLKPATAAIIRRNSQISLSGHAFPDPDNQCMSQPVPYIFWNFEIELLQQPDKVTILYNHDHDFRDVRLNQTHPANIVPSWHGDSVGHYEGDTLVVDTIGIKTGPWSSLDRFGTPYTNALHVTERYRFLPYEEAKAAQARGAKEWGHVGAYDIDPNYRGRGMQLEFKVDDPGVFTMPYSATVTYLASINKDWEERVCAENTEHYYTLTNYYSDKSAHIPTADKPDF
ncbi:MAG TPA: hypothetical protein VFW28_08125 [Micropepsaceae bacterium]|nr:hypothetical protein [Micropepsaceae bacterium]